MPSCTAPVKPDSQRYSVSPSSRQQLSSPASTSSSPPSDLSSRESSVWLSAMATSPLCWAGGDISLTSHHQTQPSGPRLRGRLSSEFKVQFLVIMITLPLSLSLGQVIANLKARIPRNPLSPVLYSSEYKDVNAGRFSLKFAQVPDCVTMAVTGNKFRKCDENIKSPSFQRDLNCRYLKSFLCRRLPSTFSHLYFPCIIV